MKKRWWEDKGWGCHHREKHLERRKTSSSQRRGEGGLEPGLGEESKMEKEGGSEQETEMWSA